MALRGSIDDVPIVDVLQFVHLSGKSGTLALTSPTGPAWVEFNQGHVVFARGPQSRSLGELLVEHGGLTREQLHDAIEAQRKDPERPALGRLLLQKRIIEADRLADCVRRQIHEAMMDIANWRTGEFQFDQGSVEVLDDTRFELAEVLPLLKLNTQFLLFEAVRLFDERQRDQAELPAPSTEPPGPVDTAPVLISRTDDVPPRPLPPEELARLAGPLWRDVEPLFTLSAEPTITTEPPLSAPGKDGRTDGGKAAAGGVLLVGFEKALSPPVGRALVANGQRVLGHVPRREVDALLLGPKRWPSAVVVLWRLRSEVLDESLQLLDRLAKRHPDFAVVAVVSGDGKAVARAYAAGARAVLPVDPVELARDPVVREGLVAVVAQVWRDVSRSASAQAAELRAWLQAKRLTSEMQRALQKASIALELMRVAAGALDRAALFLAKESELIGLGAFGVTASGKPMAESLRGLALNIAPETPLWRSLQSRMAFVGPTRELGLGQLFFDIAGRPAVDRAVLVPLVGPSKAIGLLYGDNGQLQGPMRGIHAIEIAAAQAGVAYENVLLRMRLGGPAREEEAAGDSGES